jgi:exopolysaccharide biosynthesis WecB/TagA/CpsF family protein
MKESIRVSLLPAHPDEGSASMLRYWMMLQGEASSSGAVVYDTPYAMPAFPGRRSGRFQKAISRYFTAPFAARALPSPIVHILDHSSAHLIPFIPRGRKVVVTLHDLIPLRDPGFLSKKQQDRYRRCVRNLALADHIICVSEYTRNEAHELLGIPFEKMTVIPEGSSLLSAAPADPSERPPDDTIRILSVGSDLPRKNLRILPVVADGLIQAGYRVELLRVGALLGEGLKREFEQLDAARFQLRELGKADDGVLSDCYRSVDCVLIPSLMEGFGLPVLESMALGCPVVCSNTAALPEAGGGAALYFDPLDPGSAVTQILQLKRNPTLARELIALGRDRSDLLSWGNHFEGVKKIYQSVCPEGESHPEVAEFPASRKVLESDLVITDYSELCRLLFNYDRVWDKPLAVDFANTQIVTMRRHDPEFGALSKAMDITVPDGMPLIWVMNAMGAALKDRVYGPAFMKECIRCSPPGIRHYFLGGSQDCLDSLLKNVRQMNPRLSVCGSRNGYFKESEESLVIQEIQKLEPDFLWVGLGTPKQQEWIARWKSKLAKGVVLAVGFAFDVNAGTKTDAPLWMQRLGLTWVHRMASEPRRLIGRYLKWNSLFLFYLGTEIVMQRAKKPRN